MIEAFKKDDFHAIKDKIEAEPRMILESWSKLNNPVPQEIKKDYKAEMYVRKVRSK